MLRKDYNNTEYTVPQINDAVGHILASHKGDYKLEGYHPDSVKLSCRNGYDWSSVTEIMWDKVDNSHLDILIEYRSPGTQSTDSFIQNENAQKHLTNISELLMKYMNSAKLFNSSPSVEKKRLPARFIILFMLLFLAVAIATITILSSRQ